MPTQPDEIPGRGRLRALSSSGVRLEAAQVDRSPEPPLLSTCSQFSWLTAIPSQAEPQGEGSQLPVTIAIFWEVGLWVRGGMLDC